jgi:hypothetical protein
MTRWPEHLRDNVERRYVLRRFANGMRGLFGQPVYLVGSALLDGNSKPRDWDIRIVLPDRHFVLRYGGGRMGVAADGVLQVIHDWNQQALTGDWRSVRWRWSDDCVKYSLNGMRDTGLNIDFQVYPQWHANQVYHGKPRLQIDRRRK